MKFSLITKNEEKINSAIALVEGKAKTRTLDFENTKGKFLCGEYRKEKPVSEFSEGEVLAHTMGESSKIMSVILTSKCYRVFMLKSCNTNGIILDGVKEYARRYRNTVKLCFIGQEG